MPHGGTGQPKGASHHVFCFVHLSFTLDLGDFGQSRTEQPDQGGRCALYCTSKTRRHPVLCKGFGGHEQLHKAEPGQIWGDPCTLQSQRGATDPPTSASCCSHLQRPWSTQATSFTSPGFQVNRAGQFGPGAFITNLFSFPPVTCNRENPVHRQGKEIQHLFDFLLYS